MTHALTPSQTVGPFYWGTLVSSYHADLAPAGVAGERIEIVLQLHDVASITRYAIEQGLVEPKV